MTWFPCRFIAELMSTQPTNAHHNRTDRVDFLINFITPTHTHKLEIFSILRGQGYTLLVSVLGTYLTAEFETEKELMLIISPTGRYGRRMNLLAQLVVISAPGSRRCVKRVPCSGFDRPGQPAALLGQSQDNQSSFRVPTAQDQICRTTEQMEAAPDFARARSINIRTSLAGRPRVILAALIIYW